jgi:hypothetical protein
MKEFWGKFGKTLGLVVGAIIIICLLGFLIKMQFDNANRQEAINKSLVEMKQLTDGIVRNQTKYVSKEDLRKFADDLDLEAIEDDLDELNARLIGISKVLASSGGYHGTNLPSDHTSPSNGDPEDPTTPVPTPDPAMCPGSLLPWCIASWSASYLQNMQTKDLHEPFGDTNVPVGSASFSAWRENPWDIDIHPRDYEIKTVLGRDRDDKHYMYHQFTIRSNGEKHRIKIDDAQFLEEYPESEFMWWAPKFYLGVTGGVAFPTEDFADKGVSANASPSLFFSPFAYGRTNVNPEFTFLQLGAGVDVVNRTAQFSLTPFAYNLGTGNDIINNTYVGPTISIDTDKNVSVGGTVSLSF